MAELLPSIQRAIVEPYPEILTAIQCIRAEGLKTALATNNWLMENGKSFCPVDVKHFDVVSSSFMFRIYFFYQQALSAHFLFTVSFLPEKSKRSCFPNKATITQLCLFVCMFLLFLPSLPPLIFPHLSCSSST